MREGVLIPRPETEFLVDLILRSGIPVSSIFDVGTGSGVILLSLLAERPSARGIGGDLSPAALAVAEINARRLGLAERATFLSGDRFAAAPVASFDLLVANPPYIKRRAHRTGVHEMVHAHEPDLALYLDDETYDRWFEELFSGVRAALIPGGFFFMEGHEAEVARQVPLLEAAGLGDAVVLPDLVGRPRFLRAQRMM